MYILFCSRGYPSENYPLIGIFEKDQAIALSKLGNIKIIFLALDTRSIRRKRNFGIEILDINDNLRVYKFNYPIGNIPKKLYNCLVNYIAEKTFEYVREREGMPSLVHSHFIQTSYNFSFLKTKFNLPFIVTEHSSEMHKPNLSKYYLELGEKVYKVADTTIVVSESLGKNLNRHFDIQYNVVGNVFESDLFKYNGKSVRNKFELVSVGNLVEIKNMDLLIKSFSLAKNTLADLKLRIFGDGIKKEELYELIDKLSLHDSVFLEGNQSRNKIAETFNHSSIFILLSKSETFGVAFIEALASGLPVISTKSGGPESFIYESNGVIVDFDEYNISDAIINMVENLEKFNREKISLKFLINIQKILFLRNY